MVNKRNPDWNGHGPKNDKEAKELIIKAALKVAERDGLPKTNIKKVADELGITRQTVYRLFPSSDELLTHISVAAGGKILDRLLKNAFQYDAFEDRVIESMIFLVRNIPQDEFLKQYFLVADGDTQDVAEAFSKKGLDYSYQMLKAIYPESSKKTTDEKWLMELAEHQQHLLLSLIVAPTNRTRSVQGLRDYLDKWLRPLLNR